MFKLYNKGLIMKKNLIHSITALLCSMSGMVYSSEFNLNKQIYTQNETIKINYSNIDLQEGNWIGVWRYKDGPGSNKKDIADGPWHQKQTNRSDAWEYIYQESGSLEIDAKNLSPGRYAAFILRGNGYTWLGQPVLFDITDENGNIDLKTLMFNIWQEGTSVNGGFEGIVNEIVSTNADLISLSEVRNYNGSVLTQRLIDALKKKGFTYYSYKSSKDVGVISRYPIKTYADFDRFTKSVVEINDVNVTFYSGHLDYTNYATYLPRGYDANFNGELSKPEINVNNILRINDASARPASIKQFIADAKKEIGSGNIVIMSGDFNEPSWLDWTYETRNMFDHNGTIVPWTSTKLLDDEGYKDAYRVKYPDPVKNPGFTWLSDNLDKNIDQLTWAPKADERDRIDFTFYYPDKRLSVLDATIVGPSTSIVKSERVKESGSDKFKEPEGVWPSDHKALSITFSIKASESSGSSGSGSTPGIGGHPPGCQDYIRP